MPSACITNVNINTTNVSKQAPTFQYNTPMLRMQEYTIITGAIIKDTSSIHYDDITGALKIQAIVHRFLTGATTLNYINAATMKSSHFAKAAYAAISFLPTLSPIYYLLL